MENKTINNIKSTFSWFLDYVLIVATIMECNSLLLVEICAESKLDMQSVFAKVIIATAALLLALKLTDRNTIKVYLEKFVPVLVVMEVYAIIYYLLGVRPSHDYFVKKDFIKKFLLMLPMYSSLLFIERKNEKPGNDRLIYKYSNVVCIIAFLNLIVYYMSTFHVNDLESELVYLRWYNNGVLSNIVNCLNVCYLHPGTMAQSFNIHFLRDFGPFVEPLMFLIPLGTALFVELFLRGKDDKWCLWRCLLLSATIFTVQSTYGLMMLVIAWGVKLIVLCNVKERMIALVPTILLVFSGCGYFVAYKMKTFDINLVFERLMENKHFTDYVYPLKAFLSKPFLAGGYLNNDLSISFFSEEALKDTGFSNSIAVVLGQGGIFLGLLCMLPFLIGLLQLFSKNNRKYALFMLGPLYLYTVTIFHYRYFLIFIFALGYSLLEVEKNDKKRKAFSLKVIRKEDVYGCADTEKSLLQNVKAFVSGSLWKEPLVIIISALLIVAFGTGIWDICFKLLYFYQLSSGQSGIRVLYGIISLIALLTWCRVMSRETVTKKQKITGFLYIGIIQVIYAACAYNTIYSYADTAIQIYLGDRELVRETLMLLCYLGTLVVAHIVYMEVCKGVTTKDLKKIVGLLGIAAGIACCLGIGNIAFIHKLKSKAPFIEAEIEPLRKVSEVKTGKLYSDELSVLYNSVLGDITYGAVRGEGYRVLENATILEPKERELPDLFNEGYQVTQISDDHIIYTNDENVISRMTKEGYKFYRYYAFEREIDLEEAAKLNGLAILGKDGEKTLLVEGGGKSLIYGPYDVLKPGTYTVSFSLKIDLDKYTDVPEDTVIADVRTSHKSGQKIDQQLEVKKSNFDDKGCADIESIFTVNMVEDGYEYLVLGKEDFDLKIQKLTICQTPNFITLTKYNVHQYPIFEAYYGEEGNPSYTGQAYVAVEKKYNAADRIMAIKYLDENSNLKLIKDGYAEINYEYDDKMQLIKELYFDENGEITTVPNGYSGIMYSYDDSGRKIEYRYCDAEGRLVNQKNGVAIIKYRYNDDGKEIRLEYYNHDEKTAMLSEGFCTEEYDYNDKGQKTITRYLGKDDKPVERTDTLVFEIHYFYDEKGRDIRQEFYGADGKRTLTNSGYSAFDDERDANGNVVSEEYYGINDERVLNTSGFWRVTRVYNNLNQKTHEEYFGTDGEHVLISERYTIIDFNYDNSGKLVKRILKDMEGKIVEEQSV